MWKVSLSVALWALAAPAAALECRNERFAGQGYAICEADMARDDLRVFLADPETGAALGSFARVKAHLQAQGQDLVFAMNAGMYHADRRPVGLYVEGGQQGAPLVTRAGPGNFGMLPNGVFCIRDDRADVIETRHFAKAAPACRHASQSGPMLVIDGALHPRFLPDSDSRYRRNGVGTSADGQRVVFAISDRPVNFHDFASVFRDHLNLPQALYFDGNISRLFAPALGRDDPGFALGPMVGAVRTLAGD